MDVVGDGLHAVRELFRVGDKAAVFVALLEAPAVVDDDVFIALVAQAAFAQGVGGAANKRFVDIPGEGVPRCV